MVFCRVGSLHPRTTTVIRPWPRCWRRSRKEGSCARWLEYRGAAAPTSGFRGHRWTWRSRPRMVDDRLASSAPRIPARAARQATRSRSRASEFARPRSSRTLILSVYPCLIDQKFCASPRYCETQSLTMDTTLGSGAHGIVFGVASQTEKKRARLSWCTNARAPIAAKGMFIDASSSARSRISSVAPFLNCSTTTMTFGSSRWPSSPGLSSLTSPGLTSTRPPSSRPRCSQIGAEKEEQFGARWRDVQAILAALQGLGIFMLDVNPGNVSFGD